MFKGHPKGLYVAFFTNMGERFGYYTMLAIFVLYLQSKFGWSGRRAKRTAKRLEPWLGCDSPFNQIHWDFEPSNQSTHSRVSFRKREDG